MDTCMEDVKIQGCPRVLAAPRAWSNLVSVGDRNIMPRKLTHDFVKAQFKLVGYEILNEYVNDRTPIKFRCPHNHIHQIRWNDFRAGKRCGICFGMPKLTREFIGSQFTIAGYELIGDYVNNKTPIKFRCDKGHISETAWISFKKGHRCAICAGNAKLTHDFVKAQFALAGYELMEDYVNSCKSMKFRCDLGHVHEMSWTHFNQGKRCGICSKTRKLTHDFVKAQFALAGYELMEDYVNNATPMQFRCDVGHTHRMTFSKFQAGGRCGICNSENFYADCKNRASIRIVGSIKAEIKRQKYSAHWSYFYTSDQIKQITETVENVYYGCSKSNTVDHIVPISCFNLLNEDELIACWDLRNLRYLSATENFKRKNKMTPEEIDFMEQNHPEIINAASRRPFIVARMT